jgi:hypothetical protein
MRSVVLMMSVSVDGYVAGDPTDMPARSPSLRS